MVEQKSARLQAMLDDVEPTFLLRKMLDESSKQFKHSSNIIFLFSFVS